MPPPRVAHATWSETEAERTHDVLDEAEVAFLGWFLRQTGPITELPRPFLVAGSELDIPLLGEDQLRLRHHAQARRSFLLLGLGRLRPYRIGDTHGDILGDRPGEELRMDDLCQQLEPIDEARA